jgi:phosphoglycolate phosphatase-like HAD superfamily hydrolase
MKLLLFDLDGTILRATRGAEPLTAVMEEIFGVDVRAVRMRFGGKTDPMIVTELLELVGAPTRLDATTLDTFHERLAARMADALACGTMRVDAVPGVREVLDALVGDPHFALGVLTGNLERCAHLKLRAAGLDHFFATGAFGSDAEVRAALPEIARARFRGHSGIDVPLADCVIIGDTPLDFAAAERNGMPCVLVASGWTPPVELVALGATAVFPDWSDGAAIRAALAAL